MPYSDSSTQTQTSDNDSTASSSNCLCTIHNCSTRRSFPSLTSATALAIKELETNLATMLAAMELRLTQPLNYYVAQAPSQGLTPTPFPTAYPPHNPASPLTYPYYPPGVQQSTLGLTSPAELREVEAQAQATAQRLASQAQAQVTKPVPWSLPDRSLGRAHSPPIRYDDEDYTGVQALRAPYDNIRVGDPGTPGIRMADQLPMSRFNSSGTPFRAAVQQEWSASNKVFGSRSKQ